ncbi:MAG: DinB family protein [Phycisphaerales bacterium]|nr:MAG: DinB family protein [Phycisphaerales bacterium]
MAAAWHVGSVARSDRVSISTIDATMSAVEAELTVSKRDKESTGVNIGEPGIWLTDPKAYQKKLSDLLGERDPLDVMAETPAFLANLVSAHSPEVMRTRPFPKKWTPNEIIGHLTDTEIVFAFRIRTILCEDNPVILGMDQELWVERQRHNEREPVDLASMFQALRHANLVLWRQMKPADLKRTGRHSERGPETLKTMLRMEAGHDIWHMDQITRYLSAITGAGANAAEE